MASDPYIFITHSSRDTYLARRLHLDLAAAGVRSWLDVQAMRDGDRWVAQIQQAIEDSTALLLVHTRAARTSEWVEREILYALDEGKPIFIARCDETPLPLPLITRQYTDFLDYAAGLRRLIPVLRERLTTPRYAWPRPEAEPELSDEERFFLYLGQLPQGDLAALVARDLYTWARHWADDLTFRGQHAPSLYVQQFAGAKVVTLFAVRGYLNHPAVQIGFDHLARCVPDGTADLDDFQAQLAALQPPASPYVRTTRRPNLPLTALNSAEALESFKTLIVDLRGLLPHE